MGRLRALPLLALGLLLPVRAAAAEEEAPDGDHAPKFSLWAGARASVSAFGLGFYENERGEPETTGNYLKTSFAPELDVGARLFYRFVPYVFWEHGFTGAGHRFENTNTSASTDF